jgi:hypothetical protein
MVKRTEPELLPPDDPIFKRGLTIYTPPSARPKPTPQPPPDAEEGPEQED